jgi:hypothetical protein
MSVVIIIVSVLLLMYSSTGKSEEYTPSYILKFCFNDIWPESDEVYIQFMRSGEGKHGAEAASETYARSEWQGNCVSDLRMGVAPTTGTWRFLARMCKIETADTLECRDSIVDYRYTGVETKQTIVFGFKP